ncbi:uncharacterized protein LOC120699777 isoform X3 [Panicum virgatum]|uniref:uncharacterized protein LOC120699777 isoform X3 n=1 Tax=Panicum virgatum TaxID=38727 RepID=UPI0019D653D3|nr:uncharacterized protein LOC120699777 isoform X3 [Panicum virgatum]
MRRMRPSSMVAPPDGVPESLNSDGTIDSNEDMTQHTMMMVELSEVLKTPDAEMNRGFFDAPQQELEKKAYSQEGCVHVKELQRAEDSHSPCVPPQGNSDCDLMDEEDIFVDDEVVSVDIGQRDEADPQEAAWKNQSEELKVEPILYADTAAAQTPVDGNTDFKLNIVYDKENPRIKVNEYFPTMEDFRMALRLYGINKGFQVHKVKTDKTRYRAECKATGCPWRIVARKLRGLPAVVITMMPAEHNCMSSSNLVTSMASQKWVAQRVVGWLRENPDLGAKELQGKLQEVYNIEVGYATVWAGRQKALNKVFQSWEDNFQILYNFRAALLSRSPGSVVDISTKTCGADVHFDKLFFALQPCIDGFKNGCRPEIALEFTDLDGMYSGKLACACALDGHNWMYPVAWAIFDSDSNANLTWFMEQLKKAIGHLPGLAISTDEGMGFHDKNLAESYDEWTMNIKDMPLVDIVDRLRQMTMEVWYTRSHGSKLSGNILPAVIQQLNAETASLRNIKVCRCGLQTGEVSGNSQDMMPWRHVVDLNEHTCSCGEWQLTWKPCLHALAWITTETDADIESFVHDYYSVERFRAAYSGMVPPMPDKSQWPQVDPGFKLLAPLSKQGAGKRKYTKANQEPGASEQHQLEQYGEVEHCEKGCTLHCPKKRKRCQAEESWKAEDDASWDGAS